MNTGSVLIGKNGQQRTIANILESLRMKNEQGLLHIPYVNGRPVLAIAKDATGAKGQLSFIGYKVIYPFMMSKFQIDETFCKEVSKFLSEQLSSAPHMSKETKAEVSATAKLRNDIASLLETIAKILG